MKKLLFSLLILSLGTSSLFAGEEEKDTITVSPKIKINVSAAIKNQHYWRGYAVATSPLMTSMISVITKSGFEIGTWNGFGLDGGFKDVDTYISYSKGGFSIALWDVYNFSDYTNDVNSTSFPYGNYGNTDFFNYSGKGRHFIDASIGYSVPKSSLSFFLATIIAGRDVNANGKSAYSTYFKTAYGLKAGDVSITPYTSVGFAFNSINGENFWKWTSNASKSNFNFSEVGINFSKPIKVSGKISIAADAGFVVSPVNKTASGLFGITLF